MQSTLKRGLHAPETTVLQALESSIFAGLVGGTVTWRVELSRRVSIMLNKPAESGVHCQCNQRSCQYPLLERSLNVLQDDTLAPNFVFLGNCIF